MKTKILGVLIGLLLLINEAHAQGLRLGEPGYGGNGCPAGTASVTLSPDQTSLSILFDNYIAEAGGMTGKTLDRRSCNISIPVQVPNGYSVSIFQLDYRGFNSVPRGGQNQFNVEYFWAGYRGPTVRRTFNGPVDDNFTVTDRLIASTQIWSKCGESVILRVNSSIMAKTNRYNDTALAIVDTADMSTGLIYHIQYRRCN